MDNPDVAAELHRILGKACATPARLPSARRTAGTTGSRSIPAKHPLGSPLLTLCYGKLTAASFVRYGTIRSVCTEFCLD